MCALDDPHYWAAIRYVELNPVRAGMAARAEDYAWSSARAHCGLRHDELLSQINFGTADIPSWSQWVNDPADQTVVRSIRLHTSTGRPLGSMVFIDLLESILGRTIRPKKPGRPRKAAKYG